MEDIDIVEISNNVLVRLSQMDYERIGGTSKERLIFPNIFPSKEKTEKELEKYFRISEQELRFLFVEEFLKQPNLFYSVETPTQSKYKFGKKFDDIDINKEGRSASIDMSVFNKDEDNMYQRILNIEFKNQNSSPFGICKDVLKLMNEEQNGAFIILLSNTDKGTLCNEGETGVLDKLNKSFTKFKDHDIWKGNATKHIHLIILSLEQNRNKSSPILIHREIVRDNLEDIKACFTINDNGYGNITTVSKESGWELYQLQKSNA